MNETDFKVSGGTRLIFTNVLALRKDTFVHACVHPLHPEPSGRAAS